MAVTNQETDNLAKWEREGGIEAPARALSPPLLSEIGARFDRSGSSTSAAVKAC